MLSLFSWPRKLICQFWDFHTNQPESVHALMHLFGSRGIPDSIRRVTGFGVHTFKLVTADGTFRYCKFHFRPTLEITHFSGSNATRMAGANPDYHNQDLWDAIAHGNYPVWKLYVQIMESAQAETFGRGLFDITKVWPHKEFPLIEVGKMTLNKNVREIRDNTMHWLTLKSPRIISRKSSKLLSRPRIWSLGLR